MILTLRTDRPEAELALYDGEQRIAYESWQAHRELAETIHYKIQALLTSTDKQLSDITGIVVYAGPGSFTGLRIGVSVANALAEGLRVPVAGSTTDDWITLGLKLLELHPTGSVVPQYGADVHITQQRR